MNIIVSTDITTQDAISNDKKIWKNFLKRLDRNPNLSCNDKIRCMFNKKKKTLKNRNTSSTIVVVDELSTVDDELNILHPLPTYEQLRKRHLLLLAEAYK
jgi:hypothetical protein